MHSYYLYILTNRKNELFYTGVTNDLTRRIYEHKEKLVEGFTRKYNIDKLVFYEKFENVEEAIEKEKLVKRWKREWKINLIESINPKWKDLTIDL